MSDNEYLSDDNISDNENSGKGLTEMDLNSLNLDENSESDNDNLSEACETVDIRGNETYQVLCSLLEDDNGNNIATLLSEINNNINEQFSKLNNLLTQLLSLQIRKYKKKYSNEVDNTELKRKAKTKKRKSRKKN